MGERAVQFFLEAEKIGGFRAKVRLASLARTTSTEAAASADDPVLLARLSDAIARLRREIAGTSVSGMYAPLVATSSLEKADVRLRRHIGIFVDLMSQRALVLGDRVETARRVTEAATSAIDVARVSIWMLGAGDASIVCTDLYEAAKRSHSSGLVLLDKDFRPYFEALKSERTIMAADARTDPRTSCFTSSYLEPLGIGAMLDVPIWVGGKMVGVVCHEHVGGTRIWDADDERFAYLMSNFVALAIERSPVGLFV